MTARVWSIVLFTMTTALSVVAIVFNLLAGEGLNLNLFVSIVLYTFAVVGFVIVLKVPENRVGWLCLGVGLAVAIEAASWGIALYGLANPGWVPNPELFGVVGDAMILPGVFTIATFLLILFPDGRLPSLRWRWLAWLAGTWIVLGFLLGLFDPTTMGWGRPQMGNPWAIGPDSSLGQVWASESFELAYLALLLVSVLGSVTALVVRYRRSSGVERKQMKWFAFASSTAVVLFVVAIFLADIFGDDLGLVAATLFTLIPISIGIAVLRYRLYDIDRIVSRTLTYGLVVGSLALVYATIAVGLPQMLGLDTESPPLLVAIATLTAAGLFNPLRRQVQSWVDRRFNRARFDARQEVDRLADHLRARGELDQVTAEVVRVVSRTMQPEATAVWIRDDRD